MWVMVGTNLEEAVGEFADLLCSGQPVSVTNPLVHLSIQGHEGGICAAGAAREPSSCRYPALDTQQRWGAVDGEEQEHIDGVKCAKSGPYHDICQTGDSLNSTRWPEVLHAPKLSKCHVYLCACGHDLTAHPSKQPPQRCFQNQLSVLWLQILLTHLLTSSPNKHNMPSSWLSYPSTHTPSTKKSPCMAQYSASPPREVLL